MMILIPDGYQHFLFMIATQRICIYFQFGDLYQSELIKYAQL